MKIIQTDLAPKAVGTYSQGIEVAGLYYFSGQIGLDPKSGILEQGFSKQLSRVLSNIDGLLESQGLNRNNIIKTTIFLKSLEDFSLVNQAYEAYFSAPFPARSCVEVSRMPKDALVEIEVIASTEQRK
jgi:2-iminobutanoate/2-iminopropanoate deaminase